MLKIRTLFKLTLLTGFCLSLFLSESALAEEDGPRGIPHYAPNVTVIPSRRAQRLINKLFHKSEYQYFDKQKKLDLFQIPTLR